MVNEVVKNNSPVTIAGSTLVPIGLVCLMLAGAYWVSSAMGRIEQNTNTINRNEKDLTEIRAELSLIRKSLSRVESKLGTGSAKR